MKNVVGWLALFVFALLPVGVCGARAQVPPGDEAHRVVVALEKRFPGTVKSLQKVQGQELYEVFSGNGIFYVTADGKSVINGPLVDVATGKNLTQERLEKLQVIDFKSLPAEGAIEFKKPGATRTIAVFADPRCGFCKKFEKELEQLNDVNVRIFPIAILGEESKKLVSAIYCSADPAAAWSAYMLNGVAPPSRPNSEPAPKCDTDMIDKIAAGARSVNVRGTPVIFYEDGTRTTGVIQADALRTRLAAVKAPATNVASAR